jgi:hypothetical protein
MTFDVNLEREMEVYFVAMSTCKQRLNQTAGVKVSSLPTRQQLEKFLQSKGGSSRKLEQMTTWEQIQLTREYQQSLANSSKIA